MIRYALIGFGGIAENRVAKEGFARDTKRFSAPELYTLKGATDLNPARQQAAEALGLVWYKSVDDILADREIDAVYVATNNASHAALAEKALRAGKHVLVEKPMTTGIADAENLIRIAGERNLSLAVDHMMINNAWNILARNCVQSGKLGVINDSCFHMEFLFGADPAEAKTWRCANRAEMGGPVGDVASHCMYVAEFVFGEPIVKVAAVYYPKLMSMPVEDGAYVKFTLNSGMTGTVKCAFNEPRGGLGGTLGNLGYEIYGDKAALRGFGTMFQISGHKDEAVKIRLELDTFDKQENLVPPAIQNIYQVQIGKHAKSILDGKRLTGEDALHNLKLCDAIHRSAQNGGKLMEIK